MHTDKYHDELTGLPSAYAFKEVYKEALRGQDASELVVLVFDLSGYGAIHRDFGREVADKLVQDIAEVYSSNVPKGSSCARLWGDEFVLMWKASDDKVVESTVRDIASRVGMVTYGNGDQGIKLNISWVRPASCEEMSFLSILTGLTKAQRISKHLGSARLTTVDWGEGTYLSSSYIDPEDVQSGDVSEIETSRSECRSDVTMALSDILYEIEEVLGSDLYKIISEMGHVDWRDLTINELSTLLYEIRTDRKKAA